MAAMSDYLELAVLNSVLNGATFPSLPSVWLGLALGTAFAEGDTAPYTNEASGGGYARVQLTDDFTCATAAGVSTGENTDVIAFPEATADYSDTVEGWGLFSAATGGNLLLHGVTTSKSVADGSVPWVAAADLVLEAK